MLKEEGMVYIRTTREPTPILYDNDEAFTIGGSKEFTVGSSLLTVKDEVTLVAAGITVHEALKAQQQLKAEGIAVRVIDCYSIKPIDVDTLKKAVRETKAIITVEDHYPVGGLGDAVLEALAGDQHIPVYKLAVMKTPRSAKPEELLDFEEISAKAIVKKVKIILSKA
jgi:transketolase